MMRTSLLDVARRRARSTPTRRGTPAPVRRGLLTGWDPETGRALVQVLGSEPLSLPALAGTYTTGDTVAVQMDAAGRPVRVLGVAS